MLECELNYITTQILSRGAVGDLGKKWNVDEADDADSHRFNYKIVISSELCLSGMNEKS